MAKFIFIPHANINFAYLEPDKYKFVIETSYEKVLDIFREKFPKAKFSFETSGYTIEQIALYCPRFLEKLIEGCRQGQVEFIGSPYAHSILANYPYEDGLKSLQFSMETYEKYLGFRPKAGFSPEITWRQDIPMMFKKVGFESLVIDWESYLISNRPEVSAVERNPDKDSHWGGAIPYYDIDVNDKTLHYPMQIIPGLKGFARTDRVTIKNIFYFQGRTFKRNKEIEAPAPVEDPINNIKHWAGDGNGALIVYADDIEYIGTNCYYEVKYAKDENYRVFQPSPGSISRFEQFIEKLLEMGELITFSEAIEQFPTVEESVYIEDGMAWHRTYAEAWARTPASQELDAICNQVRETIELAETKAVNKWQSDFIREAWLNLIIGENSDGRWPPPPKRPCQYSKDFCCEALRKAAKAVEWAKYI